MTAIDRRPSSNFRAAWRIAGLFALLLAYAPCHIVTKLWKGSSPWPYRFLRSAARICGLEVRAVGPKPYPHTLLIANHLSWLDILVLGSATGCAFVSKDRLGNRLIHWLADQNNTVYVDRNARRSAGDQVAAIQTALQRRPPITIFPEGTTGPGAKLLPFRSSLLEAVAPPPSQAHVQPVAIDYFSSAQEIAWFDEAGRTNVMRMLGRQGTLPVTVRLLERLPAMTDRKALAALAQERIAASLAASSSNSHPL